MSESILVKHINKYVLKRFKEGDVIKETSKGFLVGDIHLEFENQMNSYTILIEPQNKNSLIQSFILKNDDGFAIMRFIESLHESQEYSHIINAINSLE